LALFFVLIAGAIAATGLDLDFRFEAALTGKRANDLIRINDRDVTVGLKIGRESGRTRLARASVTAVPFPSSAFDIVTSFDVLYSLGGEAERAAVAEMYRTVKPGGVVLLNVAAMDCLRGDHSVLSREVRRYSRESLIRLLTSAGFAIERITYTNAVLFPAMYAARIFQRWRGLSPESEADQELRVPARPVNLALAAALGLEARWLRLASNPFGSSLLCVARKPG